MKKICLILFALVILNGCQETYCPLLGFHHSDSIQLCTNCQSPNIHNVLPTKSLITYIQSNANGQDTLMMRSLDKSILSDPIPIASGDNWFVNWADIPSVVSLDNTGKKLMAHWLQMSASGTYDYDIRCATSNNGGKSWSESFILHDDKVSAEHGFVTMTSTPKGAFITWLDGRNTKTTEPNSKTNDGHSPKGDHSHKTTLPMSLRAAWIDSEGKKLNDAEIDKKVCDCCQTDAIMTGSGPIIVYRDRSDDEVRDISIARYIDKTWEFKNLHKDNWTIAGCPVNGPAVDYNQGILAVAWYTQMNNMPKVFLIISRDDGATFGEPILIDDDDVMGRVDIAIDDRKNVIVTWMKNDNESAFVNSRIYSVDFYPNLHDKQQLLSSKNERKVGFPIIEIMDQQLVMVRTVSQKNVLSIYLEKFEGP